MLVGEICPWASSKPLPTGQCVTPLGVHTRASDLWRSEAEPAYSARAGRFEYKPASKWVDNFIVHDDNFGMNLCLPIDSLKRTTFPKYDPTFRALCAGVLIPKGVRTLPTEAEYASSAVARDILIPAYNANALDAWCRRLIDHPETMVIRTFLVSKDEYANSLFKSDFKGDRFFDEDREELTPSRSDSHPRWGTMAGHALVVPLLSFL